MYDDYYCEMMKFFERVPTQLDYETEEEIARIFRGRRIQR